MSCLAPNCGEPAILLGLCVEHFQRPGRKHRMTAKRKATIMALAEKYVAANDPPRGVWPGLHYSMGRGYSAGSSPTEGCRMASITSSGTRAKIACGLTSPGCVTIRRTQSDRWPNALCQKRSEDRDCSGPARAHNFLGFAFGSDLLRRRGGSDRARRERDARLEGSRGGRLVYLGRIILGSRGRREPTCPRSNRADREQRDISPRNRDQYVAAVRHSRDFISARKVRADNSPAFAIGARREFECLCAEPWCSRR